MSKEKIKRAKQRTTGMDVLYRIIMAAMAVAVPLTAIFSEFFHFILESQVFAIIAQLKGDTSDDGSTEDGISLYTIFNEFLGNADISKDSGGTIWAALEPVHTALICAVAFFAIALLVAVVVFFFSCFSNKKMPALIMSLVGLISMVGLYISFGKFAAPITDGTINLGSFFGSGFMYSLLQYVASFSELRLSTAATVMTIAYVIMICWSGAYVVIELGDKSKKLNK